MGMRTSQTFIASFLDPCCCVASQNLSQKSTFIMPPKSRRSSRARTPSTRLNSPGSLAAKRAPAPSEHSAILTALNNIAERQDRVEARLVALPQFEQAHAHGHLNVDQPTMATSTDVPVQVQEPATGRSPGPTIYHGHVTCAPRKCGKQQHLRDSSCTTSPTWPDC